jgi:hypothetical protein
LTWNGTSILGMKRTGRQLWRTGGIASSVRKRKRASTKLPGTVERVIKAHPYSGAPEKAQIAVEGADHLYREWRVPNQRTHENGHPVRLKEGTEVEVKIESEKAVKGGPAEYHLLLKEEQRSTPSQMSCSSIAEPLTKMRFFPLIGLWASPSST